MARKGISNNPAGRPAGTPNKLTEDMRTRIRDLIDNNWQTLQADIDKLAPKERVYLMEKLMQYITPKPQHIEFKSEFERMTDEQLDYIIETLKNSGK